MVYHIVAGTFFDFDMFIRRAEEDRGPRHTLYQLAERLQAKIHQPGDYTITLVDKLLSKLHSTPEHWAMAKSLASSFSSEDTVYSTGEDIGLPLAFLLKFKRDRPKLITYCMVPDRPRTRTFIKLFSLAKIIDLFTVHEPNKEAALKRLFNLPDEKVFQFIVQADEKFFTPGPASLRGDIPLLASAGLEQRDYATLAEAVAKRPIEVKVCAFSPNASNKTKVRMPETMPENMEIRYFEFSELRELYRSADIVVISLLKNNYAGLTVLMEGMACQRPIIITNNEGLASEIVAKGLALGFEPGDAQGLQSAIDQLLSNPEEAKAMAERARSYFFQHHSSERYVDSLFEEIQFIAQLYHQS
ncbi:glycosyltransferase family 4 protein [Nodosilinea sp. E11]|uniref:glycosyltransferase family 4 protein n=1 Tax=Nodosilinea sp. E11 TaxID=3037479 RepID=UPI0029350B39|nr:glycosyltransferase family 4 protein [Nodosilinea sp. E11]WOD39158.1 glycosyltransferase family 4 protein [Nodosilinea sp. E11]